MRILCVIDSLGSGGAQRQMVNLACGLKARGHAVELFLYYPHLAHFRPLVDAAGIPVHEHPKRTRLSLAVVASLIKVIWQGNYDVVVSFLTTPNVYAELAHLVSRRPVYVASERSMYLSSNLPVLAWLPQQCHRLADHITVNSHHQRERMENMFPWMRGKISTIYNGIDIDTFRTQPRPEHVTSDELRLLVLSSVIPMKNATGLVQALAICRERYGLLCTVDWAGKVSDDASSQQEYHRANRLLKELGLQDQWCWLGERRDVVELLGSHDALIHPSFYEGLPNAICEALASGCPVLASNVCDHPRLVEDGVTGLLFDPCDPECIAAAIQRFAMLPCDSRTSMSARARAFAKRELALEVYAQAYESLFLDLLGSR